MVMRTRTSQIFSGEIPLFSSGWKEGRTVYPIISIQFFTTAQKGSDEMCIKLQSLSFKEER